jgi:hypothetical protein
MNREEKAFHTSHAFPEKPGKLGKCAGQHRRGVAPSARKSLQRRTFFTRAQNNKT